MTSLLVLTSDHEDVAEEFRDHFDEVEGHSLADARIRTGQPAEAFVDDLSIQEYDAVYLVPEPKASIYTRVLLESIQESQIACNLDPSSFMIMAKKHYLLKVLHEKDVPTPRAVAVSSEKGLVEIEDDLDFPAVARLYEEFEKIDTRPVEDAEDLNTFASRSEHGQHIVIAQDMVEGDVFDVLYIDGETISLHLEGDRWARPSETAYQYHSLTSEQQEIVEHTAKSIGTPICRVRIVDEQVVQVEADPELEMFAEESGKNVHGKVAKVLQGDDG